MFLFSFTHIFILHYFCAAHARILHQFLIAMLITQPQRVLSLSLLSHTTILFHSIPLLTVLPTIHYFVMDLKVAWLKKVCLSGQENDVKLHLK